MGLLIKDSIAQARILIKHIDNIQKVCYRTIFEEERCI